MVAVWAALLNILLASVAFAGEFSTPVSSILDGDTIDVLHNTRAERIRLNGIDRPEKGQAYGTRAKQAASLCGIEKGRPDQVDPLFIILIWIAFPETREPEADQP